MFTLLALFTLAATGAPSRADQLEKLKQEIPAHPAGNITTSSEAHVQKCFQKYRKLVQRLELETLAEDLVNLREQIDADVLFSKDDLKNPRLLESERIGIRQNIAWMHEKLTPYVARLTQFQRGR